VKLEHRVCECCGERFTFERSCPDPGPNCPDCDEGETSETQHGEVAA